QVRLRELNKRQRVSPFQLSHGQPGLNIERFAFPRRLHQLRAPVVRKRLSGVPLRVRLAVCYPPDAVGTALLFLLILRFCPVRYLPESHLEGGDHAAVLRSALSHSVKSATVQRSSPFGSVKQRGPLPVWRHL